MSSEGARAYRESEVPSKRTLNAFETILMLEFDEVRDLCTEFKIPYRFGTEMLARAKTDMQLTQSWVIICLAFLFGGNIVKSHLSEEEYSKKLREFLHKTSSIAANIILLNLVMKGKLEYTEDLEQVRVRDSDESKRVS